MESWVKPGFSAACGRLRQKETAVGIHFDKVLDVHADALALRAERTRVLAANIANENTPGYQARDIDFASALAANMADDAQNLALDAEGAELQYRRPNHAAQDGNTVEIGVEQAEFSQNSNDFQMSLTFLNMKFQGLAKAISGQ